MRWKCKSTATNVLTFAGKYITALLTHVLCTLRQTTNTVRRLGYIHQEVKLYTISTSKITSTSSFKSMRLGQLRFGFTTSKDDIPKVIIIFLVLSPFAVAHQRKFGIFQVWYWSEQQAIIFSNFNPNGNEGFLNFSLVFFSNFKQYFVSIIYIDFIEWSLSPPNMELCVFVLIIFNF